MTKLGTLAVELLPCPRATCTQPAGSPCITRTGRRATTTHTPRWEPIARVWSIGYREGGRDTLTWLVRDLEKTLPRIVRHSDPSVDVVVDKLLRDLRAHAERYLP